MDVYTENEVDLIIEKALKIGLAKFHKECLEKYVEEIHRLRAELKQEREMTEELNRKLKTK